MFQANFSKIYSKTQPHPSPKPLLDTTLYWLHINVTWRTARSDGLYHSRLFLLLYYNYIIFCE